MSVSSKQLPEVVSVRDQRGTISVTIYYSPEKSEEQFREWIRSPEGKRFAEEIIRKMRREQR